MWSNYWAAMVTNMLDFGGVGMIGLMTASQEGAGWSSAESASAG